MKNHVAQFALRCHLLYYWLRSYVPGTTEFSYRKLLWTGSRAINGSIVAALVANSRIRAIDISAYRTFHR